MTETPVTQALEYLIRKGTYWYRPDCAGYTGSALEAGRYTKEDALKFTHPNGFDGPRDGLQYYHLTEVRELTNHRAQSEPSGEASQPQDELREALSRIGEGEFYANGDTFDLYFRPGGGSFAGNDKIVAKMACGDTAHYLPSIVARALNAILAKQERVSIVVDA